MAKIAAVATMATAAEAISLKRFIRRTPSLEIRRGRSVSNPRCPPDSRSDPVSATGLLSLDRRRGEPSAGPALLGTLRVRCLLQLRGDTRPERAVLRLEGRRTSLQLGLAGAGGGDDCMALRV